ncbi:hypothetical protein M422DRAFT_75495 [Sphaerobolus stellatus SS14]|uniref:Phytanoyl-CoA dioxygenase n=1 Tax=Sphaerobolus stellatus (strain SS14) TaxID=990650 RepID=A0A0C9ULN7_SPHS4|nr:hypothetical protein M422DRAFT_75495 [Sphaerobolus stellatus SS14]
MQPTLKETYDSEGYVIVPGLISPEELSSLTRATERVIELTRLGKWPHRRTVGKQFPPFNADSPDSWGVQHVMHPDLGAEEFVKWYTSDAVVDIAKKLMACDEDDLQMELFNILINPESHNFALRWHRDDIRETASEEEEKTALGISHYGVQWNTALYDDSCLYIVPKSHKSTRTADQRAQSSTMDPPAEPLTMPGVMQVHLKSGETVFYNSNILHCATYSCHVKRATLHACMGDSRGGSVRARNILQHGLEWMKSEEFAKTLPDRDHDGRAKKMWVRLLEMEKGAGGKIVYSLDG